MNYTRYFTKLSVLPIILGWRCPVLLGPPPSPTADICEKVLPAVFRIIATLPNTDSPSTLASGFFIRKDGTGLTAAHALSSNQPYKAKLYSGEECALHIISSHSASDLSLVKVEVPRPVPFLALGDSSLLRKGEQIIHFGNTIFENSAEIDVGYVSQLQSEPPVWANSNGLGAPIGAGFHFIKTQGSVRPGFSGGPLVNMNGEVVGVITNVNIQAQGPLQHQVGTSIPINIVKGVIKQIELAGSVKKPYIGLSFMQRKEEGIVVIKVQSGSPAEKAGVQIGDIVLRVNGKDVHVPQDIFTVIGFQIGVILELEINRNGKNVSVTVYT